MPIAYEYDPKENIVRTRPTGLLTVPDIAEYFRRVANDPSPVFIKGETGTGRLLIAGAIHFNSGRSENGFSRSL